VVHFSLDKNNLWHLARMEFSELLEIIGDEPVFETGMLLAGDITPADIRRQISRWKQADKIYQLRRQIFPIYQ
jgi:hypothetical protein